MPSAAAILAPLRYSCDAARNYSFHKLRRDLVAGLTVSVVEVPQAMAYALIAGVSPEYGIYASIIQGIVAAVLSSSTHIQTGPTNTQSLLIASAAARVAAPGDPAHYLQLVFALAIIKGVIQIAFAAANLGDLVRYVSRSVIVGVAAGAGALIFIGQLPNFLGVSIESPSGLPGALGGIANVLPHLGQVNSRAVLTGIACLGAILLLRRLSALLPGPLVAVVGAAAVVALAGWSSQQVPRIDRIEPRLPSFGVPAVSWTDVQALISGAAALALLGIIESISIAKSVAQRTGERIVPNHEFLAQGAANVISGFLGCIPGSGSFTRSALNLDAGGMTRFAAVFNSLLVAAIFFLLAGQASYIPKASLAAVLLVISAQLVDWRYMARIARTSRSDLSVCLFTLAATLLLPLEYAVFTGIFLSLALYLRRASKLHMAEMIQSGEGRFVEMPLHDRSGQKQVMFLQVEGELFFGVADELAARLAQIESGDTRAVIFRLKRTHSIDSTVLAVLEQFVHRMHERRRHVILCGLRPELMSVLGAYGLVELIGRDNVFPAGEGVFASAKAAIARARRLIGQSIDVVGIDDDLEDDEPSYEI